MGRLQPLLRQPRTGPSPTPTTRPGPPLPIGPGSSPSTGPTTTTGPVAPPTSSGNEFPVIYQAEQLGLDVTYWTDVDLHARPELLASHRALISLGHDEYWSAEMRDGAAQPWPPASTWPSSGPTPATARCGSNRLLSGSTATRSATSRPTKTRCCARTGSLVTVNWPQAPVGRPEAELIGSTYQDVEAHADLVFTRPASWPLAGVELPVDRRLPGAVQGEFDRLRPAGRRAEQPRHHRPLGRAQSGRQLLGRDLVHRPGGGGVFATGNASWVGPCPTARSSRPTWSPDATPGSTAPLLRIMQNLYSVIGIGPASATRPSQGNWTAAYPTGSPSSAAPDTVNSA